MTELDFVTRLDAVAGYQDAGTTPSSSGLGAAETPFGTVGPVPSAQAFPQRRLGHPHLGHPQPGYPGLGHPSPTAG